MIKKNILCLSILIIAIFLSCDEEEQTSAPYVGIWQTSIYATVIDEEGSLVNRRMISDVSTDSFTNVINHVIGHIEYPLCGISGSIEPMGDDGLNITLNRVGSYAGTNVEWYDAGTSVFDSIYALYVEDLMPVEFEATYQVEGDHMDLIISSTGDTIQLTRQ